VEMSLLTADNVAPRIFDSPPIPADPTLLEQLENVVDGADLAAPPVVLPDFCHKARFEAPSSIAVATRATIRPTLTSSSLNCGMALIAFDGGRPSETAVDGFYRAVRERFPDPPNFRRQLTTKEVRRCAIEGGAFSVDRYDMDPSVLNGVEEFGCLDLERYGGAERARRELPWLLLQMARIRFAMIGPSTHFVELQEVEEILDPVAAERLGLRQDQLTLQFHNGGGILTSEIGRLYGRREDYPLKMRAVMGVQKPLHHLASARSLEELRQRYALYFQDGCPPVSTDTPEGSRLMLAQSLAMNYGFAYRLATYAGLCDLASRFLGVQGRLLVDSPHNAIYEEEVGGEPAIVHRHNSARAYPASRMAGHPVFSKTGQPVLLPGTNRTSSYLCIPSEGAVNSLYSACHGTGSIIDRFVHDGLSGQDPLGRSTMRYRYSDEAPAVVPHLDDEGVNEGLRILTGNDLVQPVARLHPFAVLS
jgi:tRNA-splicing ligase RtcB